MSEARKPSNSEPQLSEWEWFKQEMSDTCYGWLFFAGTFVILLSPWADTGWAALAWGLWLLFCGWLAAR